MITTKCRYGTRALIEIAVHYGRRCVTKVEISKVQEIPKSYLENILVILRNSGLINVQRGAKGGYTLGRAPSQINMLDVVTCLEGPQQLLPCLDGPDHCKRIELCAANRFWHKLQKTQNEVLRKTTLEMLAKDEIKLRKTL